MRKDGKLLVLANGSTLTVWSADPSSPFLTWKGHGTQVSGLALSRDGKFLASVSGAGAGQTPIKGDAKLWNAGDLAPIRTIAGADVFVAVSPNGKRIAARHVLPGKKGAFGRSEASEIGIWDADSGELVQQLGGHSEGVWSAAFLSDDLLLSGGGRGSGSLVLAALQKSLPLPEQAILWDLTTGKRIVSLEGVGPFVAASADGMAIAST